MGKNEQSLLAQETGKGCYCLFTIIVILLFMSPPESALARAPRSTGVVVSPSHVGEGIERGCRSTRGTIEDVEVRLEVPAHAETAEVGVTVRSEREDEVTVTLGMLSDILAMYDEIRVGRKVAVHCSVPSLEFF